MTYLLFILTGVIISLGFIGSYLFNKKGIPDNLLLIFFGVLLGPVFNLIEPSGFQNIAPIFSSLALLVILFDGGMNLNLYKVLDESPKAMVLGVLNVIISMAVVTTFTSIVLGWSIIYGLLLGTIVGGTSSSIVLSLTKKLGAPERIETLLSLESVFTDAIVVVLSITFLDLITETKNMVVSEIAQSIASTFSIGIVLGLIFGVIWVKLLSIIRDETYDDILTLSVTILFYGVTEYVGGNGAIFALIFGLVLGNSIEVGNMFRMEGLVEVGVIMRKFMNQISFFIRTYFFVYLGLILFIENRNMILYSIILSILLLVGRYIGVTLTAFKDTELQNHINVITFMMPRGLAAAIMAQLVVTSNIEGASMFPDLILIIIIASVVISSLGTALLKRGNPTTGDTSLENQNHESKEEIQKQDSNSQSS